jgi:hypothetical protein
MFPPNVRLLAEIEHKGLGGVSTGSSGILIMSELS